MKKYEIAQELKKWEERVIFPNGFKENTTANLDRLKEIEKMSWEHFILLNANSESLVYKIAKYFITLGLKNENFTFIDGKTIESYIGDSSAEWRKKERADDFFNIFGETFKGKWVLIPYMTFKINIGTAIYFMTNFRKCGANGVIFYAEGPENMGEVLNLQSDDEYLFEFPKKCYRKKRRKIEDDEY